VFQKVSRTSGKHSSGDLPIIIRTPSFFFPMFYSTRSLVPRAPPAFLPHPIIWRVKRVLIEWVCQKNKMCCVCRFFRVMSIDVSLFTIMS